MENVSWKDHMTNEYVLDQVNEKRKLLNSIKTNETCKIIKRRALDRDNWETGCLEPALEQSIINDDLQIL